MLTVHSPFKAHALTLFEVICVLCGVKCPSTAPLVCPAVAMFIFAAHTVGTVRSTDYRNIRTGEYRGEIGCLIFVVRLVDYRFYPKQKNSQLTIDVRKFSKPSPTTSTNSASAMPQFDAPSVVQFASIFFKLQKVRVVPEEPHELGRSQGFGWPPRYYRRTGEATTAASRVRASSCAPGNSSFQPKRASLL